MGRGLLRADLRVAAVRAHTDAPEPRRRAGHLPEPDGPHRRGWQPDPARATDRRRHDGGRQPVRGPRTALQRRRAAQRSRASGAGRGRPAARLLRPDLRARGSVRVLDPLTGGSGSRSWPSSCSSRS
jgi:hypothetical protein